MSGGLLLNCSMMRRRHHRLLFTAEVLPGCCSCFDATWHHRAQVASLTWSLLGGEKIAVTRATSWSQQDLTTVLSYSCSTVLIRLLYHTMLTIPYYTVLWDVHFFIAECRTVSCLGSPVNSKHPACARMPHPPRSKGTPSNVRIPLVLLYASNASDVSQAYDRDVIDAAIEPLDWNNTAAISPNSTPDLGPDPRVDMSRASQLIAGTNTKSNPVRTILLAGQATNSM